MADATGEMRLLTKPRDDMAARRTKAATEAKPAMPTQKDLPVLPAERAPLPHESPQPSQPVPGLAHPGGKVALLEKPNIEQAPR